MVELERKYGKKTQKMILTGLNFCILIYPQVMSILAPQKYIDNKEEVLFARSPIPNFLNYLRRRRREKESKKPDDDDDEDGELGSRVQCSPS